MENKKVIYYKEYTDDVVESKNQNFKIDENYKWIHKNIFYKIGSALLWILATIFSFLYYKLILHVKVENKKILKKYKKQGYFVYGNHTQPLGDVFIPRIIINKRFYTICSEANLGIPVIGKILPSLGALVIPEKISQMEKFMSAISYRISKKSAIVIYPEAHVWPYYTKIRNFPLSSFRFQVENNVPAFSFTTTYYKRKNHKKPGIKVYVDGPFFVDNNLKNMKEKQKKLCEEIHITMEKRSKFSNINYIEYKKINEK